MKSRKLIALLCLSIAGAFVLELNSFPTRSSDSFQRRLLYVKNWVSVVPESHAAISDAANMAKFLYYLIQGPPSTGYPSGMNGPEEGLVGIIGEILGPDALGNGLSSNGIDSCSEIPTSGSVSMTESDGTFVMSFGVSQLTIPSGWSDGGSSFDKRVSVSFNGTDFMVTELKCNSGSAVSGYLLMDTSNVMDDPSDPQNRSFETYFQFNSSTNQGYVDFYMDASGSFNEKFAIRFETDDGNEFEIWAIRGADENSPSDGHYIGVRGNSSAQIGEVRHIEDSDGTIDDTTAIGSSADQFCVNFASNSDASGQCGSLAVQNPSVSPMVSGGSPAWTINWVWNSMSLSSL